MQSPSGVGKEDRGDPDSRERYCASWWDDMLSVPYGKGDVRKAVGRRLTVIEGGISNRPCGPLVAVGAMCCVRAFMDGLLARIADTRETSSWLHLYQTASLDCCVAALMVMGRVLPISLESKRWVKVICGKVNGAFTSKESCLALPAAFCRPLSGGSWNRGTAS